MKINLAGLARQAANAIDPKRDHGAYACCLEELAAHIEDVRAGRHTLEEFADYYMIRSPSGVSK